MSVKDQRTQRWMNRMCDELPARTREAGLGRGTCILHTKLALLRAREDGLRARPLACRVEILNAVMAELTDRLGRAPERHEWGPDAWSLGIGHGRPENEARPGYDGHVVVVVNERFVMDLTLDQASRPQKNIHLRPGFFGPLPTGFLAGETTVGFTMNGSRVQYTALPGERGYLTAPDWTLVRAVDPRIRRMLAA